MVNKNVQFFNVTKMALERHPFDRRCDKDIVRMCLTLWCRSPRGYTKLRNSKIHDIAFPKMLQKYKNTVHQQAGINKDILCWMAYEAKLKKHSPRRF